ncbi:MAG TPA: hypothetical protein VLI92_00175 [Candidatus Saccharimonadales bacterium]|nr:hypothetical protein [Candidatus Saccharimonadales bacterium]
MELNIEKLFEVWNKALVGNAEYSMPKLELTNKEAIKLELYKAVISKLEELVSAFNIDAASTKSEYEYLEKVFNQVSKISDSQFSYYPKRMLATKKATCAGNTLLMSGILNNAGLKLKYGRPIGHSMTFALIDEKEYWVDGANRVLEEIKFTEEVKNNLVIRRVNSANPKIPYQIIPTFKISDIIINFFGNTEGIKQAAAQNNPLAVEIMREDGVLLNQVDFMEWRAYLYPEYDAFQKNDPEFQKEKARVEQTL